MDYRQLFLYNVLPKKRILIAFIGFLISSTIISGGALLMISIVESTSTYLGETDDVVVISNPYASTPYTSILPLDLAESISKIDGVLRVSPEVMSAAVYKNSAVYFRGIDVNEFWKFTDIIQIIGKVINSNDTTEVSLGVNFAERNHLYVGDFLTVFSTISDSALELKVKSIVTTGTLLDDEIIAPLWVGQFLSFETFDYVSHIRVKIDLNVIKSKEYIRELVTSKYTVTVQVLSYETSSIMNSTLYIKTSKGDDFREEILINTDEITMTLPFGEYEFQADIEGILSDPVKLIIQHNDTNIPLFVPFMRREVNFRVITDEDEPIEKVKITIYSQEQENFFVGKDTYHLTTNSTGQATKTINDGNYVAIAEYGLYSEKITFVTQEETNLEIILIKRHPLIDVKNPLNNSVIIGNALNISIDVTQGYSIFYYIDGNSEDIEEYYRAEEGEIKPISFIVPFENGEHSLTVVVLNSDYDWREGKEKNYGTAEVHFTVTDDFTKMDMFYNAMNGTQLRPNTLIVINSSIQFSQDIVYKWDKTEWNVLNQYIHVPHEIGVHKLFLHASFGGVDKQWSYYFIVTDDPEKIGVLGMQPNKFLKDNDIIKIWHDNSFEEIFFFWDNNTEQELTNNNEILIQGLNDGIHILTLAGKDSTEWFNKTYEIKIDNTPPLIFLDVFNNSVINSGSIINCYYNENFSKLSFSWDDKIFSKAYENKILVPELNGNHTLAILVEDLSGNQNLSLYSFSVVNFIGTPIDFFLSHEYSGIINQSFIDLFLISSQTYFTVTYNILGVTNRSGTYTTNMKIYLHPGIYTLTVKFWLTFWDTKTRVWNFIIPEGLNVSYFEPSLINDSYEGEFFIQFPYFDVNYTLTSSQTLFLMDGDYYCFTNLIGSTNSSSEISFLVDSTPPILTVISPNKGENEIDVFLILESDATEIYLKLDTLPDLYTYSGIILLNFTKPGETHKLTFYLIDAYYNYKTFVYSFITGLDYVPFNLTFQLCDEGYPQPVKDLNISIQNILNGTIWEGQTNDNGSLEFLILPGEFIVDFTYESSIYSFTLNSAETMNETITIGTVNITIFVVDYFSDSPISNQYCIIRNYDGHRLQSFKTNVNGIAQTAIVVGEYVCYFSRYNEIFVLPFEVYLFNQTVIFNIPSVKEDITFSFKYDNGTLVYNMPIEFNTILEGRIVTSTGLKSSVSLKISYGIINITVEMKNGELVTFRRIFEPGMTSIKIVLRSESESQYTIIPFKPIGDFEILISLSFEYMDYYLKGSLLFTYTLVYTEIILILVVVIVNMLTILRNVYSESRRETVIIKTIGGTNFHTIISIFSRLAIVAVGASIIGYGLGAAVLIILAKTNKNVFFGHTFAPSASWEIFLLNLALMMFAVFVSTFLIARKTKKMRIAYTRR